MKTKILLFSVLFFLVMAGCASATSWLSGWNYCKPITLNTSEITGSLNNYTLVLKIVNDKDIGKNALYNGNDLRFTEDNVTCLPYSFEKFSISKNSCYAIIYVNLPNINNVSNPTLYMYYGNNTATVGANSSTTWNSNYYLVQHMNQNPSKHAPQFIDSTSFGYNGVSVNLTSANSVTGIIGNAIKFTNNNACISISDTFSSMSSSNPLFSGSFGSVWYNGSGYQAWTSVNGSVDYLISTDGTHFTNHRKVLNGTANSWDSNGIEVVNVWFENGKYNMLYRGNNATNIRQIGYANSSNGIKWIKYASNPVFSMNKVSWGYSNGSKGCDPWGIIKIGSTYYMWFNTVDKRESTTRETGLATSTDLIHWTQDANNPIFSNGRYCVQPFWYKGSYYMVVPYNSGFNVVLELYKDIYPNFHPSTRKFIGVIATNSMPYNANYLDTPSIITNDINLNSYPDPNNLSIYYTGMNSTGYWNENLENLSFNSLSSNVLFNSIPSTPPTSITLQALVNLTSVPTYSILIDHYSYGLALHKGHVVMGIKANNTWRFAKDSKGSIRTNSNHLVAATYNATTNLISYFIDGKLSGTDNTSGLGNITPSVNDIFIGDTIGDNTNAYRVNGIVDEVRLSSTDLSTDWLSTDYHNQISHSTFYNIGNQIPMRVVPLKIPKANLSVSSTSGNAPLTITFTDKSTESPTSWKWNFGDGIYSTVKNPKHTYSKAGNYSVKLTVSNKAGSSTKTKNNYIKVTALQKPIADFRESPKSGKASLKVQFNDKSTGSPTSWSWNFGDGGTSTVKNPMHKYTKTGKFTVKLAVKNSKGTNSVTKPSCIIVK